MGTLKVTANQNPNLSSSLFPPKPYNLSLSRLQPSPRVRVGVWACIERNPISIGSIGSKVIGSRPVFGLVARIFSDEGGVGGDVVDFAEFRWRVGEKCGVSDSRAFYEFQDRRGRGMGEPLHNIDNVLKAAAIMVDDQGLHFSPRKVTVSTSGLVPQLKRFLRESNCTLAVSLNATTDEIRNWIMPINRKYNLSLLLETLREELRSKHRYKVLFEYVMLAGVNDSLEDAKRIVELVRGIPCKINLISFNPHRGSQFSPTPEEKMIEFRNALAEAGVVVFLRSSRGDDRMAACGQLGEPGDIQPPLLRPPARFQMAV